MKPSGRIFCACLAVFGGAYIPLAATPALPQTSNEVAGSDPHVVWVSSRAMRSDFVPDAEVALLDLINRDRAARQLMPLVMSAVLRNAARQYSRMMATRGFIGHISPLGQSLFERLSPLVPPGTPVGENITFAQTVGQAHQAFAASSGHRNNMLAADFGSAGIGVATANAFGLSVTEIFSR